jgi:2-polyprenyl-3-methyl-5-hydroxy-6-metoxy-1,4-benzoquinol methylase
VSEKTCLVCGGRYGASRLPGLLQCQSCGFITANLRLSQEELERLYSTAYFTGEEYNDYLGDRTLIERHFRERLRVLARHVDAPQTATLFEVGCAYGFFLHVAQRGFKSVSGVDISTDAVTYAREQLHLDAVTGDFATLAVRRPVDVVCMWDTIEHLADPDVYVRKAAEILRPGGHLAITTGDIGSLVARWRGSKWRQIHPPTHLHYFSRSTLTQLLEREGFRVRYVRHDGMYRSVETMAYIMLAVKHRQRKLFNVLKRTGLMNWSLYLNLFDILFVIAQKTTASALNGNVRGSSDVEEMSSDVARSELDGTGIRLSASVPVRLVRC